MADIITEYIYYICPLGSQIKVSHKNSKLYIKGKFKDLSWMSTTNQIARNYLISIIDLLFIKDDKYKEEEDKKQIESQRQGE